MTAYIEQLICNNCNALCSASESRKKIRQLLDLAFFFRCKHVTSFKTLPSLAPGESLPYWFQGNFAAMLALNYWSRDFLLSVFANRSEWRFEPKQLMLFYYKIGPC